MSETTSGTARDVYFTSRDGLRLHARSYDPVSVTDYPVICLPGLTRNARDFTHLAEQLCEAGHRVLCVDYRGRGLSEHDTDWKNYSPFMEALDLTDLMAREMIHRAHIVGTSRGGLIAMIMAALRPTALRSIVLNDIGPVIEADGLARIIGYAGRVPEPVDWDDAANIVRDINARDFPNVSDSEWRVLAEQWFNDSNGRPVPGYDKSIAKAVTNVDLDSGPPELWPQFNAMRRFPLMIVRGENSDILSAETAAQMCRLHPDAEMVEVPGQGHAPLLRDAPTVNAIVHFLDYNQRVVTHDVPENVAGAA